MSIPSFGRIATTAATFFLIALFVSARAHAQAYWASDVSVSNITSPPTQSGADIAHVSLVVSNTSEQSDVLLAVEVSSQIAQAAGFDALSTRVYRGASLRRSQPVFFKAGETRHLGFEDVHLVIYGIRGPFRRGHVIPVRLIFEKAGPVDVLVEIGNRIDQTVSASPADRAPRLTKARYQQRPVQARTGEPERGSAFRCEDGRKMVLAFAEAGDQLSALIWLGGETYTLPYVPPEPGPVQIVWSDGNSSLTWSPGVRLMWMSGDTHLMCGRGGHSH